MPVANLFFHIEDRLDMVPVKLQGSYGANLVVIFVFVSILPGEGLWWITQTDAHHTEYLEERRQVSDGWGKVLFTFSFSSNSGNIRNQWLNSSQKFQRKSNIVPKLEG